ncbi:MAG TPA: rhodanese-like domain-containing protein [Myxococcota bacterium]|nr:rhodanese-like domain-containing protein [Myxococcota bacterium]HND31578.1 rhodanese-like domain-containing protein [Myxococcota bacterium]
MLRRLLNLPITVASRAARAFQERQDAQTREKYNVAHDPGDLEVRGGPTYSGDVPEEDSAWAMDVVTVKALLGQKTPLEFVDVREAADYGRGHMAGATPMPLGTIGIRVSELPTDRMVIVTCEDGAQSLQAVRFFRERGMEDTWFLAGGLAAWVKAGGELARP